MEHTEAIENQTAERYALDELTPEERDRFEEHYFDCPVCAQAVRDGVTIAAGIRANGAATVAPPVAHAPRFPWWAVAAAIAFIAIAGYQNLVTIPRLRGAAATAAPFAARVAHHTPLSANTRDAAAPTVVSPRRDEDVALDFDVPPETPYPSYLAEVRDTAGRTRATIPVSAEDARQMVTIAIPPGVLEAGKYELAVSGVDAAKRKAALEHYSFEVRFR